MKPIPNKWRNRLVAAVLSMCSVCACLTYFASRGSTTASQSLQRREITTEAGPVITATFVEIVLDTSTPAPTKTALPTASSTDEPTHTPRPTATEIPATSTPRPPTSTPAPTRTLAPAFTATAAPPTLPPQPTLVPTQAVAPTQLAPVNVGYACSDGSACIKGNISSDGRRLYHLPGCPSYNATVIDPGKGERWFVNEAEAIAAGWTRAGNC